MSYDLWITLTAEDRHNATRTTANACFIAEALQRTYGGEWAVTGSTIVQSVGDEVTWRGRTTFAGRNIIARYDMTGTGKAGRRVKVATARKGGAPRRVEQHPDGRARTAMWQPSDKILGRLGFAAAATGTAALVAMDLTWVVFTVIGVAAAGLSVLIVRKHKAGKRHLEQDSAPATPQRYVHVQRPARQPAPAQRQPETLYSSGPPVKISDPDVTQPVPAETITTGGAAA